MMKIADETPDSDSQTEILPADAKIEMAITFPSGLEFRRSKKRWIRIGILYTPITLRNWNGMIKFG